MKPEAQRIAIAEACGWKNVNFFATKGLIGMSPINVNQGLDAGNKTLHWNIPDYLNNLNAIDSAVLSTFNIGPVQLNWDYARHLGIVTGSSHPKTGAYISTALIHATAAQRAEDRCGSIRQNPNP